MTKSLKTKSLEKAPLAAAFDVRDQFPILSRTVNGMPLVYLDSAASTQKPRAVLEAMTTFYQQRYANVHRGLHTLSIEATDAYEAVRDQVKAFLNAPTRESIIFTKGTTEAINLVAHSFSAAHLRAGDSVILSAMEHHSNIVPWQMARDRIGFDLRVIPVTAQGTLDMDAYAALLARGAKLVAVTHVSNALGTINPVKKMIAMAHAAGARVLVDGCQAVPHFAVDVQDMDADFYVFSGHKLYAPTGVGVLYGRRDLLDAMPPYQGGGEMIDTVTFERTTYAGLPHRFEAGTPPIVEVIGLGAALTWLEGLDREQRYRHESRLCADLMQTLNGIEGMVIYGVTAPEDRVGIVSFSLSGVHPTDIADVLNHQGIAVRAGHHCAQPLMRAFGVAGMARASLGLYSTSQDIARLAEALAKVKDIFKREE